MQKLKLIPVIDWKNGVVVQGIAGNRDAYQPIRSPLTKSHFLQDVNAALHVHYHFDSLYIADLDAITGGPRTLGEYDIPSIPGSIWLDAGFQNLADMPFDGCSNIRPIIATETASPGLWNQWRNLDSRQPAVLSLDFQKGQLRLAENGSLWPGMSHSHDWLGLATSILHDEPAATVIVLDVASVGVGQGVPTGPICAEIRQRFSECEIITGGGIRNDDDLMALESLGVSGVLISTALHEGSIQRFRRG